MNMAETITTKATGQSPQHIQAMVQTTQPFASSSCGSILAESKINVLTAIPMNSDTMRVHHLRVGWVGSMFNVGESTDRGLTD